MPSVSVIIPTYRHRDYVRETLKSVFAQTFTDYEVIVVNDGSPDDTGEVLAPLVEAARIRYFEQSNQGQAVARNRGLAAARGEFLAFLDDDDLWPTDKLERQVRLLREHSGVVVAYGQVEIIGGGAQSRYPRLDAPSGEVFDSFVRAGWIRSPGQALIRRTALERIGGFDPDIWGTDDWDLWLRLSRTGEFVYDPALALMYRSHEGNASRHFTRMHLNAMKVLRKHLGWTPRSSNLRQWMACRAFVKRFVTNDGLQEVRRHARAGNRLEAFQAWLQVIRISPSLLARRAVLRELLWLGSAGYRRSRW